MRMKEGLRGQITIFIIVAMILVGAVIGYFMLKDSLLIGSGIPASIAPIYTTFLSCLEDDTWVGIDLLESQAGYIELPLFESGSTHMPFSSQLNFLGNPIPYWYYVSGNNVQKEQIPSKSFMENELSTFIEGRIRGCIFDSYYEQGFEIELGEPTVNVEILEKEVRVNLDMRLVVNKENDTALIRDHSLEVKSYLGTLYDSAKKIYDYEQKSLFLEKYAVDTLRLYAPVDGVELTCSPLTWSAEDVFEDLQEAIEANTLSLKTEGGDYSLRTKENKYFIVDVEVDADVSFLQSRNWASGFEVIPTEGSMLIATVVGNQPGLGALGFCYVPYHFVYNVKYPVLVQVSSGSEIFQYPLAVVLLGNNPRESLDAKAVGLTSPQVCEHKNTLVGVNTYDNEYNPIEAEITYKCFSDICDIGKTSLTKTLVGKFPQCVNGQILAKAEGFSDTRYVYSTVDSGSVDIFMDKIHEVELRLKLDSLTYNKDAIISFTSDKISKTVVYPQQTIVNLSEGQYEVKVFIYESSQLKLDGTTQEQCIDVPQSSLGGILGLTEEKCFEIEIPEQIVSNALSGGGTGNYYMLDSELESANVLEIYVGSLPRPTSLNQLQDNYILFENKGLEVVFK